MPTENFRKLSEADWKLLEERADRFAADLAKGAVRDWATHLEGLSPPLRKAVLHELIKVDLDHRWGHGEKPHLEEYLTRWPELGDADDLPADLICEEYRVIEKRGGKPELNEYRFRFPIQFDEVKKEIQRDHPSLQDTYATRGTTAPSVAESVAEESVAELGTIGSEESESRDDLNTIASVEPPKPNRGAESQLHTMVSSPSDIDRLPKGSHPAPDADKTQLPDIYDKTELLGKGHFGEVWKATAPGGIEIAVKIITHPIEVDAAQRELQALELVKNLRHPCLLSTHRFWIESRKLHIAMELADGSLRDRLKACRKQNLPGIPLDELLMYFADAAEGLDFLHARKVFHRDVKPDNIMLLHGHAKVADFGLARLQEQQMMTVSFAGTPVYMAPETWGGKGGPRSDQYSLAFAYAELRQGHRPFDATDFAEVMSKALEGEPNLADIPKEEAALIRRALAKKPEDRFNSCSEFVAALARVTGNPVRLRTPAEADLLHRAEGKDSGSATVKESSTGLPPGPKRSNRTLMVASLLVVLAGVAGMAIWKFSQSGPNQTIVVDNKLDETNKVVPPPEKDRPQGKSDLTVPAKFSPIVGSAVAQIGDKKYPEHIEYRLPNGEHVPFVLIVPTGMKPFYMMENKVTNGLFATYAAANPGGKGGWNKDAPPKQPVTGIDAAEAFKVARWLGGTLPSAKQWDYAAGMKNRAGREGPSLKSGAAAVGRSEPRAVDDPMIDEGPFSTRDMAGNGREWTRDLLLPDGSMIEGPPSRPTGSDIAVVRGRNFTSSKPLTYADLEYEEKTPQTQYFLKGSPYTTFRVVVDLPE